MDANHERTLQEAARWHARLTAPDCDRADRAACEHWQREGDNAIAAQLARRVDAGIERLAHDERLQALAEEAFTSMAALPRRPKRWLVPATLAASVAIATVALHFSLGSGNATSEPIAYATSGGQQRSITLSDGSIVRLDVDSNVLVRYTSTRRHVELVAGRAYFEVAHDGGRPFSVAAAGSRTTALGTRFQVERSDTRVVVTLAEGAVAVDNEASGASRGHPWQERLQPGEQLRIGADMSLHSKRQVDPQLAISWTRGRHLFRGTPLAEALDEVNRYAATKVRLGDPSLADLEVAGSFIAGDSAAIVAAFAAVLPLRTVAAGEKEIILFRQYDTADH